MSIPVWPRRLRPKWPRSMWPGPVWSRPVIPGSRWPGPRWPRPMVSGIPRISPFRMRQPRLMPRPTVPMLGMSGSSFRRTRPTRRDWLRLSPLSFVSVYAPATWSGWPSRSVLPWKRFIPWECHIHRRDRLRMAFPTVPFRRRTFPGGTANDINWNLRWGSLCSFWLRIPIVITRSLVD